MYRTSQIQQNVKTSYVNPQVDISKDQLYTQQFPQPQCTKNDGSLVEIVMEHIEMVRKKINLLRHLKINMGIQDDTAECECTEKPDIPKPNFIGVWSNLPCIVNTMSNEIEFLVRAIQNSVIDDKVNINSMTDQIKQSNIDMVNSVKQELYGLDQSVLSLTKLVDMFYYGESPKCGYPEPPNVEKETRNVLEEMQQYNSFRGVWGALPEYFEKISSIINNSVERIDQCVFSDARINIQ